MKDPNQLDRVFVVADGLASADPALLQAMVDDAQTTPHGASALVDRARLGRIDVSVLLQYPPGSLGHALGTYFVETRLDPAALPIRDASHPHDYVLAHLYETHDIWHVLTGFRTDVAGELGLQAFVAAQLPSKLPLLLLSLGLLNTILYRFDEKDARLDAIARGWAMGRRATKLFGVRWSERMQQPLEILRREFAVAASVAADASPMDVRMGPAASSLPA